MNALKNRVQLIGHVGQDPEIKNLEGGKKVATISLATNDHYMNAKGEKIEQTEPNISENRQKCTEQSVLHQANRVFCGAYQID